jgi:hypothetical protein
VHNDATKKPIVDLISNLVYNSKEEKLYARQYFDASAPLVKHLLIQFIEAPEEGKKTLLTRFIKMDDRIVNYILGFNQIDAKREAMLQDYAIYLAHFERLENCSEIVFIASACK